MVSIPRRSSIRRKAAESVCAKVFSTNAVTTAIASVARSATFHLSQFIRTKYRARRVLTADGGSSMTARSRAGGLSKAAIAVSAESCTGTNRLIGLVASISRLRSSRAASISGTPGQSATRIATMENTDRACAEGIASSSSSTTIPCGCSAPYLSRVSRNAGYVVTFKVPTGRAIVTPLV
ncbi:hypothetical protein DMH04_31555 [Kibdelosporangium aridum]|uniref:Uncharacterized protein n=1 Tax=Kibdelosporangium aridum TaxID=2030 RepID=A0A428Z2H2_KIBAR|nr:hypothetical protein [Kibdelosporangium aridum]RSM79516.1 hypothetical protein DMH04_31555 [Kibdelosporangium aridum]